MEQEILKLQKQIDEINLKLSVQGQLNNYGISFMNLQDYVEVMTVAPTHTPKTVYDQIKLFYNSVGPETRLYIYDNVNNQWLYEILTVA
jgi:hypothetical protein